MRSRPQWLAAALAAAAGLAFGASTGKVSGRVSDAQTGEGLLGARVEVAGTALGALCDEGGYYHIINLPPGPYAVRARMTGYEAVTAVDTRVNPGLTTRLDFRLRVSPIQGREVTVTAARPLVVRDLTATQRVIKLDDLELMPFESPRQALAAQSGVVARGDKFHVRGGRSDEVSYLIDGISIRDAVDGGSGLLVNTNSLSDLSLLTGVFDAEYGQVMSGVISARVKDGAGAGLHLAGNGGALFPAAAGRGYQNYQADWGRGLLRDRLRVFAAGDLTLSDDWDPHRDETPHQDREDYTALAKLSGAPAQNVRLTVLGIESRAQFGRYGHDWYFWPGSYRSDLQKGRLLTASINHALSRSVFYTADAGWFWNRSAYGVRDSFWDIGRHWWEDIRFFDYWDNQVYRDVHDSLVFTADYNHYGYDCPLFYRFGSYWKYRDRATDERFVKGDATVQAGRHHQLKVGAQHKQYRIRSFHLYASSLGRPVFDEYRRYPSSQELYLQDKLEFEGLIINAGLRYERLDLNIADPDTAALWYRHAGAADLRPKHAVSPRLGLSYVVSPVTTFRFAYGHFFQQPPFQQYYQYLEIADPTCMRGNVLGNPGLRPPTSTSMEFGTVSEIGREWSLDFAVYFRDIRHLISLNYIPDSPSYYQYQNVDNASARGAELTVRKHYGRHFTGEARYAYATAEGTASDAEEGWREYLARAPQDSLSAFERKPRPLAFDQRHKLTVVASLFSREPLGPSWWGRLAAGTSLNAVFQYGSGLPHAPQIPGQQATAAAVAATEWTPANKRIDLKLSKGFRAGPVTATLSFEVVNLMDWNNYNLSYEREISPYEYYLKWWYLPEPSVDYNDDSPHYDAAGDADGNGVFNVSEQNAWRGQFRDLLRRNPALTGPPRLLRAGLAVKW